MAARYHREKGNDNGRNAQQVVKAARVAIILGQHILLWCSLFVAGGTIYALSRGKPESESLVAESLLLATVRTSLGLLLEDNMLTAIRVRYRYYI